MKQELSQQDAIAIARIYGAKWITKDNDCELFIYSQKPKLITSKELTFWVIEDNYTFLSIGYADSSWPDWKDSLIEVPEVDCDKYLIESGLHHKPVDIVTALSAWAGQENNDTDEYEVMNLASDYITNLREALRIKNENNNSLCSG